MSRMSMSASMYGSPHVYKPPPPPIDYGPFFSSLSKLTCRYVLDSKLLALSVLILGVSVLVVLGMIVCPFWFQLILSPQEGTFGGEAVKSHVTIDAGLYFLRSEHYDSTLFLNQLTPRDVVPKVIQAAQVFSVLGTCVLFACFGAGIILMVRKFSSVTALLIIAGAVSLGAVCQIGTVVVSAFVFLGSSCDPYENDADCSYSDDNLVWRNIPIYSQFYRVEPHVTPYVTPNWGYYIACVGALLSLGAAVLFWIEALKTSGDLRRIRYKQLRQTRDPHEHDVDPVGRKYMYSPPVRHGPSDYNMQPVQHGGHYSGVVIAPPQYGFVPQAYPARPPPSPGFQRKAPPSVHSSTSGPIIAREIDL